MRTLRIFLPAITTLLATLSAPAAAKVMGARLENADLSRLELKDLDGTPTGQLWPSDLSRANLSRAMLRGANLTGARLIDTVTDGADTTGAEFAETRRK